MNHLYKLPAVLFLCGVFGIALFTNNCGKPEAGPTYADFDTTDTTTDTTDTTTTDTTDTSGTDTNFVEDTTAYPGLASNAPAYLPSFMGGDLDSGGVLIFVKQMDDKAYFVDFRDSTWVIHKLCDITPVISPLISPDGKYVTFWTGNEMDGDIYITHLKAGYTPVKIADGFDPHWWIDPSSGKYHIVYATETGKQNWEQTGNTMKQEVNPVTLTTVGSGEVLLDKSFNGGLSKSGRYLCTAYESTDMYDLNSDTHYPLLSGLQSCNGSITPSDNPATENRMLHLGLGLVLDGTVYAMHEVFMVRNSADSVLWYEGKPPGTDEWQKPEWSTHEDYAVATAKKNNEYYVYIVKINIGDYNLGDYFPVITGDNIYPHLWINE